MAANQLHLEQTPQGVEPTTAHRVPSDLDVPAQRPPLDLVPSSPATQAPEAEPTQKAKEVPESIDVAYLVSQVVAQNRVNKTGNEEVRALQIARRRTAIHALARQVRNRRLHDEMAVREQAHGEHTKAQ